MVDVIIKKEEKHEADKLEQLIKNLSEKEKSQLVIFLQGINFAKALSN